MPRRWIGARQESALWSATQLVISPVRQFSAGVPPYGWSGASVITLELLLELLGKSEWRSREELEQDEPGVDPPWTKARRFLDHARQANSAILSCPPEALWPFGSF